MQQASDNSMLGIYVSVPFCRAKCSFCNFASGVGTPEAMESYVERLCAEIDGAGANAVSLGAELPRRVDTVYFGGGTPSLLAPQQLRRIFAALRRNFDVADGAEITLEAAPGQIGDAILAESQRLGVSRVSLGVQSFIDRESASVGRLHTERECIQEIVRLRAEGLIEVGADLIAGLPYQTAESWEHSLEVATGVGLTHLSVYMLEIDEDSRLGQEVIAGGKRFHAHGVPAEEISAELYEQACARLPRAGFTQYEISNFAGAGHRSRHNVKYWQRTPYLGFGLDAHSMLRTTTGAVRLANPDELGQYAGAQSAREISRGGVTEAFEETIFLGLRMDEGVDFQGLAAAFPNELTKPCAEAVRDLVAEDLMTDEDGRWRLTLRGRLVSNEVFGRLLEGVAV
ncbi:radical SAM family heme chaperone HemW [Granulicella paludicola]|uniref:radical SAM family heme chaperone HemW n=1 Tax=Granulicella paludicola TaxID=474951 RepID=UPI0021E0A023|nr:radical SAM family heme chaperone HemW [Granulicella paludicola]